MSRSPYILTVLAPRQTDGHLFAVDALVHHITAVHHRRALVIDFERSALWSTKRLLELENTAPLLDDGQNIGAALLAYINVESAANLRPTRIASDLENVEFIPGCLRLDHLVLEFQNSSALRGFTSSPLEFLEQAISDVSDDVDFTLIIAPIGTGVISRLLMAMSDGVLGVIRPDSLGLDDVERLRRARGHLTYAGSATSNIPDLAFCYMMTSAIPFDTFWDLSMQNLPMATLVGEPAAPKNQKALSAIFSPATGIIHQE